MTALDTRKDLIEACKRNDRRAQKKLYDDYADAMYNICFRMLQNHDDAKDVLQMAFIQVFKNLDKYKYISTPGSWIKRIVINCCISHCRKQKMHFEDLDSTVPYVDELPSDNDDELIMKIKNAFKKLPLGYRTVLSLYLFEGYDHGEISDILGVSKSTSKTQYHRAKKKLKEIMEKTPNQNL